ncbi:TnpV protein [Petralouisia muris]
MGKYGGMRRSYLKEYRKILYNNYVLEGTLFKHLAEIDQACNKRMEIIVPSMICLIKCPLSAVWLITGINFTYAVR